jgi:hypothetical protein
MKPAAVIVLVIVLCGCARHRRPHDSRARIIGELAAALLALLALM